jgi:uncharacterized protein
MNALRINVAGLLKETSGGVREYSIQAPPSEIQSLVEDARPVAPVTGQVRLLRTPQSIFARGHLNTRVSVECSRCLEETEVDVDFDIDAEYFPEIDISTGLGLPRPDDDLAFTIDPNHELDLGEAVRQHLLLELPMQSVCREACAGLCPSCGANLNEGACACEPEPADERLAPLKALLEQERKDGG